jgi:hypothetical protein
MNNKHINTFDTRKFGQCPGKTHKGKTNPRVSSLLLSSQEISEVTTTIYYNNECMYLSRKLCLQSTLKSVPKTIKNHTNLCLEIYAQISAIRPEQYKPSWQQTHPQFLCTATIPSYTYCMDFTQPQNAPQNLCITQHRFLCMNSCMTLFKCIVRHSLLYLSLIVAIFLGMHALSFLEICAPLLSVPLSFQLKPLLECIPLCLPQSLLQALLEKCAPHSPQWLPLCTH